MSSSWTTGRLTGPGKDWCRTHGWRSSPTMRTGDSPAAATRGRQSPGRAVIVFLNSDTVVPVGWLDELLAPFERRDVGAVGPRSDNVSGDQMTMAVPDPGMEPDAFAEFAAAWRSAHRGQTSEARRLVGFCLAVRAVVLPCARWIRRAVRDRRVRRRRPLPTASGERSSAAHSPRFFRPSSRPCLVRLQCDRLAGDAGREPGPFRGEMGP